MKRQIKCVEESNLRVINVSLDVVIPEGTNGVDVATKIEKLINEAFAEYGDFRAAASDVGGDITDIYERDYPDELYI